MLPKPDVFKSLSSDTYIIFGQAEGMASQAHSKRLFFIIILLVEHLLRKNEWLALHGKSN